MGTRRALTLSSECADRSPSPQPSPRKGGARGRTSAATHVPSSLNLSATSAVMASIAACASGPIAETRIVVPGPADSIISPMMEVPPTVSPPRVTQTSALKRSTIWTNLAEARAGNREVGGRAAEHIGQDRNAVAGIDAVDRFDDVTST